MDIQDFKFSEVASMDRLFKDLIEVINEAEKSGMEQEYATHVVGHLAIIYMKRLSVNDNAATVLQNFVASVAEFLGEPETPTRH